MEHFSHEQTTFWWVAIGMGVVVTAVAASLLQLLITLVKDIDRGVGGVKETLAATAGNTAQANLIGAVANGTDAILKEGLNHHLFLTRGLVAAEAAGRGYRR